MNRTDLSQIVVDTAKNFRACLAGIAATDTLAGGIVLETVTFLGSTGRSIPDGPKGYPITSGLVSLLFGYINQIQAYYRKLPEKKYFWRLASFSRSIERVIVFKIPDRSVSLSKPI